MNEGYTKIKTLESKKPITLWITLAKRLYRRRIVKLLSSNKRIISELINQLKMSISCCTKEAIIQGKAIPASRLEAIKKDNGTSIKALIHRPRFMETKPNTYRSSRRYDSKNLNHYKQQPKKKKTIFYTWNENWNQSRETKEERVV